MVVDPIDILKRWPSRLSTRYLDILSEVEYLSVVLSPDDYCVARVFGKSQCDRGLYRSHWRRRGPGSSRAVNLCKCSARESLPHRKGSKDAATSKR